MSTTTSSMMKFFLASLAVMTGCVDPAVGPFAISAGGDNGTISQPQEPMIPSEPAPSRVFKIEVVMGGALYTPPIEVEFLGEFGVVIGSKNITSGAPIAVPADATELLVKQSTAYSVVGWQKPCTIPADAALDDVSRCLLPLPNTDEAQQEFIARLIPKNSDGWRLSILHGPSPLHNNISEVVCAAGAIDDLGTVFVACHHGQGRQPFIVKGVLGSDGGRTWATLYFDRSEVGPFVETISDIRIVEPSSDCALVTLSVPDVDTNRRTLRCITPNGEARLIGPSGATTVDAVSVTNTSGGSTIWALQGSTLFYSTTPLNPASWGYEDLRLQGVPASAQGYAACLEKDRTQMIGSGDYLLHKNPATGIWIVDVPRTAVGSRLVGAVTGVDQSIFAWDTKGTLLQWVPGAASYVNKAPTAPCYETIDSLVTQRLDQAWMVAHSTMRSCSSLYRWNGTLWSEQLGSNTTVQFPVPTVLAQSPNGRHLLGVGQANNIVYRSVM